MRRKKRSKSRNKKQEKWRYHQVSTSHLMLPSSNMTMRMIMRSAHMRSYMPPSSLSSSHQMMQHRVSTTHPHLLQTCHVICDTRQTPQVGPIKKHSNEHNEGHDECVLVLIVTEAIKLLTTRLIGAIAVAAAAADAATAEAAETPPTTSTTPTPPLLSELSHPHIPYAFLSTSKPTSPMSNLKIEAPTQQQVWTPLNWHCAGMFKPPPFFSLFLLSYFLKSDTLYIHYFNKNKQQVSYSNCTNDRSWWLLPVQLTCEMEWGCEAHLKPLTAKVKQWILCYNYLK